MPCRWKWRVRDVEVSLGQAHASGTNCALISLYQVDRAWMRTYVWPYAMTRSSPISWRLGVSSFNISWMPSLLIRSAASRTSFRAPSVLPNPVSMSSSQYLSSRLKVSRWEQVEILINSAKPFLICAVGRVRRKVKSRKVCMGA